MSKKPHIHVSDDQTGNAQSPNELSSSPTFGEYRPGLQERRKQYPDILAKVASGEPEAIARALLEKELSLNTDIENPEP